MPQLKYELSESEIVMKKLNVGVRFTPKGHCEIAGRGIEQCFVKKMQH